MPRRIDLGRGVLFAGSAALLISLFLEWYDVGATGWQVFETLDLVLAALALGGLAAAIRPDAVPAWVGEVAPAAVVAVVLVQLIDAPPAAAGSDPSAGAWVALAGGVLMAAGAALSLAAISVTVQVRGREVRRRVAAVDRRGEPEDQGPAADAHVAEDAPGGGTPPSAGRAPRLLDDVPPSEDPDRTQPLSALPEDEGPAADPPPERP